MYSNYQQDNWSLLLQLAKFAYNNALNTTTGVSLFFSNKGYDPAITIHPEYNLVSAVSVMVHAWSRSFQRTIKGWL